MLLAMSVSSAIPKIGPEREMCFGKKIGILPVVGEREIQPPIHEAMGWAIREISGEELPYRKIPLHVTRDWRVQPALAE